MGMRYKLWNHHRDCHCKTATEQTTSGSGVENPNGVKRWCGGRTSTHHHHPSLHIERWLLDLREMNRKGGLSFFWERKVKTLCFETFVIKDKD
jgi:hypothetical protein